MHILTATDLLGINTEPLEGWGRSLTCPWCKEEAWSAAEYFQCTNRTCHGQVASAEDILANRLGGYQEAEDLVAKNYRRGPNSRDVMAQMQRRRVLDMWLDFCLDTPSSRSTQHMSKLTAAGVGVSYSQFNCAVIDREQIKKLVRTAQETGADFPESWATNPPSSGMAYCVQSEPHTIDRVVLTRGRSIEEVVWNRRAAGFSCLIGLRPWKSRILVADTMLALETQATLGLFGQFEEVCGMYRDTWRGGNCPPWKMDGDLLVAAPRSPAGPTSGPFHHANDIANMQEVLNDFPHVEVSLRAAPLSKLVNDGPSVTPIAWGHLRRGYINVLIGDATQVPIEAATLFERTGTKRDDAAFLISKYKRAARFQLADDIERLAQHRVFFRNNKITVRETSNEYQCLHAQGISTLANFSIKVDSSVMFDDASESFCRGKLNCGASSVDVLFPQGLLQDRVNGLQDELQRQLSTRGHTLTANQLPTVIQSAQFRKYVIPYLKKQVAGSPLVLGTDRLGWRSDRKSFVGPGFVVGVDGKRSASDILCPTIPALRCFRAARGWSQSCPPDVDKSCQDIIAMLLASCVRYYRRSVTRPVMVQQSSEVTTLMEHLAKSMGQYEVFEVNQNQRGTGGVIVGMHGYPLITAGMPSTGTDSQPPTIILTSKGYVPVTSPDIPQIHTAGRALQFALMRVVEWCIATGADDFKERPSLDYNSALMREGQWLIENVCKLEPWEVSVPSGSAIEELLAQVPYGETKKRVSLIDGVNLVIDLDGLDYDHDGIMREAAAIGANLAITDKKIYTPAAKMLPAIANYYGQEPDVNTI